MRFSGDVLYALFLECGTYHERIFADEGEETIVVPPAVPHAVEIVVEGNEGGDDDVDVLLVNGGEPFCRKRIAIDRPRRVFEECRALLSEHGSARQGNEFHERRGQKCVVRLGFCC